MRCDLLNFRNRWWPHQPHPGTRVPRLGCYLPVLTRLTSYQCERTNGTTGEENSKVPFHCNGFLPAGVPFALFFNNLPNESAKQHEFRPDQQHQQGEGLLEPLGRKSMCQPGAHPGKLGAGEHYAEQGG